MRVLQIILIVVTGVLAAGVLANPMATVTIHADGEEHRFEVEVVATPESRSRGLMYRREIPEDAGMLFVFEQAAEVGFWMRNTFIPLDMIFIDRQGRIVHIHREAEPHDDTLISSGQPVTYVLEINGGLVEKLGIATGQRMTSTWPGTSAVD